MQNHAVTAEFLCPECERVFVSGDERCPYDGTRLVNLGAGLAAGTVIDQRYTIKRLLGKGGMGSVYVARQHSMDRDVAIKIMHHRADGNHASVQRFFWEVRAARRLQNQHTITVFDFGQTERGSLYLAMELLKGTTLGHRLSIDTRLSPAMAARVGMQVCRSLEEAHGHGIIHRDLKPENIFLSVRSGQPDFVKVLDFGVAKFLDPEGQIPLTQTGTVFGTPRYMSPEQANSEPVDARSDLYALGILMYEMIAGEVPFAEDNPLEILYKHVHTKPKPLAEAAPWAGADPKLSRLVDQLLAKRREDRPLSAQVVRGELDLILQAMPDAGPPMEVLTQDDIPQLPAPAVGNPMSETREAIEGAGVLRTAAPTPSLGMRGLRKDGGSASRLVGRRSEQARARKCLEEGLRDGTPKFLWIGGETGLGKRRFTRWLAENAQKDLRASIARGLSVGGIHSGLAEMRAAFDDLLGTALLERAALRERIEEHPAFSDRIEHDLIDALVAFLRPSIAGTPGVTGMSASPPGATVMSEAMTEVALDPRHDEDSRRHLFSALHRLLLRLAKIQPLMVDFGLLNDADPMTLRFLEYLAAMLPQTPAKIVLVVRVDTGNTRRHQVLRGVHELVGWRGGHDPSLHEFVCLHRLDGADFLEFAQTIGRGFGHLSPYLLYLSGGNPADATELVEAIEHNPEHLRMARSWNPIGQRVILSNLPSTIIDRGERVLLAAIDKLGESKEAQAVLRHAALLGVSVDVDVLEKALERSEQTEVLDAVESTLETLVANGCMHEDKGSGKLRFDSGVVRELILSQIRSPRTLKKLHGVIAETVEALFDREQRTVELANHWEAAEGYSKALEYRLIAARRARAAGHKDEALQGYLMALETHGRLVGQLPTTRGDASEREILLELGRLRFELGSFEQAAESYRALVERATTRNEQRLVAEAELGLAEVQDALAEYGAASDLLKSASDRFRQLRLPIDAARCDLRRAASLERRGQTKAAREGYEASRKIFAQHQDSRGLADAYHALGLLSLQEGDAPEALRQLRRAVDLHRQLATGLAHGKVLYDLAVAAAERREYVLALDAATKALEVFDKESFRVGVGQSLGMVARVLLNQHRPAEARPFFERALRIREDIGDRRGVGEAVAALAHIALVLDQPDRALELGRRAREIYAGVGEFVGAASALRTMGVAESALRRFESALTHLRDAVATYRGLGKKDAELCLILESLADCQESMGLQKDARETLAEALEVARELQLAYQVSHLEARLRAGLH